MKKDSKNYNCLPSQKEEKEGTSSSCINVLKDVNYYVIPSQTSLRGHSKKLYKKSLKKDVKKYSFPDRAIDKWNALPEEVVCQKYSWF